MTSILFDFSNLRVGGGLQVASAVLHDLTQPDLRARHPWLDTEDVTIRASSAVADNLVTDASRLPGDFILFNAPRSMKPLVRRPLVTHDLRFTLFGPPHTGRIARREIIGFAEGTLLYRLREYQPHGLPVWRELARRPFRRMQVPGWDMYITESAATAERLQRQFSIHEKQVRVVPNRPHPVFCQAPIISEPAPRQNELHLIYPARGYPHKNIDFIGPVGEMFYELTGVKLVLHVTLREFEMRAARPRTLRWIQNHGELRSVELLNAYGMMDACFFPSLLESNSATPLEANVLGLPLIGSDRDFLRQNASAVALFDPLDATSAVSSLLSFWNARGASWRSAGEVARSYREQLRGTSRTAEYLAIIKQQIDLVPGAAESRQPRAGR